MKISFIKCEMTALESLYRINPKSAVIMPSQRPRTRTSILTELCYSLHHVVTGNNSLKDSLTFCATNTNTKTRRLSSSTGSMGLIWLDKPTLWHSSRIPSGYPDTLTEYQIWLKGTRFRNVGGIFVLYRIIVDALQWYTADWDYGLTIIYFFLAGIALFTIVNVVSVLRSKPTT